MNKINQKNKNDLHTSAWSKQADFRLKNRKWLRYSSQVARRVLTAMEDKELSQKDLSKKVAVSAQQISKLLKGEQNLTLETIAKLSTALGVELISFPNYKYNVSTDSLVETLSQEALGDFSSNFWPHFKDSVKEELLGKETSRTNYGAKVIQLYSESTIVESSSDKTKQA